MNRVNKSNKWKFIVFIIFIHCLGVNAQSKDSISIANFFSPQNLPQVNNSTRDSVYKLTGTDIVMQDNYHYHNASLYLQIGKFDEAIRIAKNRLDHMPSNLTEFSKAKYYNIIGSVHANKQETKEAIVYFEKALRLSEEAGQEIYIVKMENNIANMYFSLVDYESAYKHVFRGYKLMKKYPDHPFYSTLFAVLSISEAKVGRMKEAKIHGQIAIKSAEKNGGISVMIIANLALGEVANSEKAYEEAINHLSVSLELSEKYQQKSFIILNSVGLMVANLGLKNYSSAVDFGEKALELLDEKSNQTTVYSLKKNLASAYFGMQRPTDAYEMLHESHEIFRNTNSIENKKAINDILIKYDSERNEKELMASNNELLQKKIERSNLIGILGLFIIFSVGLVFAVGYIRHRNKVRIALIKSLQEKQLMQAVFDGEEHERERIARELHDGVASNLTAVRYKLMSNDISNVDIVQLEGMILKAHEDIRRLSHKLTSTSIDNFGFEKAILQFATEYSIGNCEVVVALLPAGSVVPKDKANILYRVAQELIQNALKHAEASEISIQVLVNEQLTLVVEDDGIGFEFEKYKESNGMMSLKRRAKELNGVFKVESALNSGTIVTFII